MTPWSDKPTPDGCRDCGAFFLDFVGMFSRDAVHVRWSNSKRSTNPQIEQLIEDAWSKSSRQAENAGRTLFNGKLCRLINCEIQAGTLEMTLGETTYKEVVGTNFTNAQLRYVHGPEVLANPLGVSAAVVSNDGYVLLGQRSQKVFLNAGMIHPVGGTVTPPKTPDQTPSPFDSMTKELTEELGLNSETITRNVCLGMVRAKPIVQPEMVFEVRLNANVGAIRAAATDATDGFEHDELVAIRNDPAAMVTYIEKNVSQLTPVAMATLLLLGQRHWGMGWFATARGYLREVI